MCTPYQGINPDGYCKDIIGYLPVYGDELELLINEILLLLYQKVKEDYMDYNNKTPPNSLLNLTVVPDSSSFVRQSCLDMVDDVYCHHYFKRCYNFTRHQDVCRETCEELAFKVCDREYKLIASLPSFVLDIINCTTLPFRNESTNCYYPDKIRGQ